MIMQSNEKGREKKKYGEKEEQGTKSSIFLTKNNIFQMACDSIDPI